MNSRTSLRTLLLLALSVATLGIPSRAAAAYVVQTLAGSPGQAGVADGTGAAARFFNPIGIAVDSSGNFYVTDTGNHVIRKITPDGTVTTFVGSAGAMGSVDGTGANARFSYPWGLVADASGNLYVCDSGNHTIRKITPAGQVSTFAGTAGQSGSDDGTAAAARFNRPSSIAIDATGNLYVTDYSNSTVRKITPAGVVTTLAGSPEQFGYADGQGSSARFNYPDGIAVDANGYAWISDSNNHVIRRLSPSGDVTTVAGSPGVAGASDGTGAQARFNNPVGIATGSDGALYIVDNDNNAVRKIVGEGIVTTIAGALGVEGSADGTGAEARFNSPTALVITQDGKWVVTDTFNQTVRTITRNIEVAKAADFNGDGQSEIVWQNSIDGSRYMWFMEGTTMMSAHYLTTLPPADWRIAGNGDFNEDGKADLVWQSPNSGACYIWIMDGATMVSAQYLTTRDLSWNLAAAGDFNGDGRADLVWQNTTTGERQIWMMNGLAVISTVYLTTVDTGWTIAGAGDFNGDGKTDLVWQHNPSGDRYIWLMNGTALSQAVYLTTIETGWSIAGSGDYNGDGKSDLLWQHAGSGDRYIWMMDGGDLLQAVYFGTVSPDWSIANH